MNNFLLTCNVIIPLCFPMAVGYFVRRRGGLDDRTCSVMNRLIYRVLLPALLFCNICRSDLRSSLDLRLLLYIMGAVIVNFLLLWLLYGKAIADPPRRGTMIHGSFRANTALFGIPMAQALLGVDGAAAVAVVIGATIPLLNVLGVLTLELCRGSRPNWKHISREIITNPLILSVLAGLLISLLGIPVPDMLYNGVKQLANIATPLSFVMLGASFTFTAAAHNRKSIAAATILKLVAIPVLWCGLGILLGWRESAIVALLAVFATPTGVTTFPMAEAMGGDGELAGEIVAITSVLSLFTMFLWIFLLKELAFL